MLARWAARAHFAMADFIPPTEEELVLRTDRLLLRPPRADDAPLLFEHCADPRIPRFMTWAPHRDPGETKTFLESCVAARMKAAGYTWCVFEGGRFLGFLGIEGIVRRMLAVRYDRAELGYWVVIDHHRRGLMTEAAGAAVAFSFARLGLHKVIVRAWTENLASLRVIEKLGFTQVGLARREVLREGTWHDLLVFEMLADDPAALRLQSGLRRAR